MGAANICTLNGAPLITLRAIAHGDMLRTSADDDCLCGENTMCFSASVSYSTAAVLAGTGLYAVQQARRLPPPYLMWALVPVFFGMQQAFEGGVWQEIDAGDASAAVPFALGFHFFSHFFWL